MDIQDVTVAHLSRRGLDEFGLRGLSHGRFTGLILTRNVAETVLLSQLQKKPREDSVDATIDALYKSKNMKPPDKVKEAATYVAPLIDEFLESIKPWGPGEELCHQELRACSMTTRPPSECRNSKKRPPSTKKRLRSAGIQVTPKKDLPIQDGSPDAASSSSS